MRQSKKKVRVIGVTGGIGSGKSTVTQILKNLGAYVIDADKIAKEILNDGDIQLELKKEFGQDIIKQDNLDNISYVDKKKLAQIVFIDKNKLEKLNKITHKKVIEEIYRLHRYYLDLNPEKLIVIDAPIPVKNGFLDLADKIWVVVADLDLRINRVKERDNMSEDDIIKRINSQLSDEEYIKLADKVIYNNYPLKELAADIKEKKNFYID